MIDARSMNMGQWWNGIDRCRPKYLEKIIL